MEYRRKLAVNVTLEINLTIIHTDESWQYMFYAGNYQPGNES